MKDLAKKAKAKLRVVPPATSPEKKGLSVMDTLFFTGAVIGLLAFIGAQLHDQDKRNANPAGA